MPLTPETFSLRNLQAIHNRAQEARIEQATIDVRFNSPDDFVHSWTVEDVEDPDRLDEEIEDTIEAARNRLAQGSEEAGIGNFEKAWNEMQAGMEVDIPDEVLEFMDLKEAEEDVEEAVDMTRELYDKVDRARAISIQSRVDDVTDTLSQYKDNIEKVEQNLEFEENTEGAWEEGRQKTTGELEYFNRDGERMGVLIWANKVQIQQGGRGGEIVREFENKEEARNFYQQDRLG